MRIFLKLLIGRVLLAVTSILVMKIMTTLLLPKEMGRYSLLITIASFFSMFLISPIGMFFNRQLYQWLEEEELSSKLFSFIIYVFFIGIFSAGLLLIIPSKFWGLNVNHFSLLFYVLLWLIINSLNTNLLGFINILGFQMHFIILSLFTTWIGLIFILVFSLISKVKTAELWMNGILIGQVSISLCALFFLIKHLNLKGFQLNSIHYKNFNLYNAFIFGWPLALTALMYWFQMQFYRLVVAKTAGANFLGLFVAGYGISAAIFALFEALISQYFQPVFYRKITHANQEDQVKIWESYAELIFPSICLLIAFTWVAAPFLTRILLGNAFQGSAKYIIWGSLTESARVLASTYSLLAHANKNTKTLILPGLVGILVTVLGCIFLIPHNYVIGTGITLSLAGWLSVIFLYRVMRSSFLLKIPYKSILLSFLLSVTFLITINFIHLRKNNNLLYVFADMFILGIQYIALQYFLIRKSIVKIEQEI